MADKAYVVVANMKVDKLDKALDANYKTSLPKDMRKAAEAAIKGSGDLTIQKPTNKDAKTFSLDATVTSLMKSGNSLEAKLSLALSEDDHMFGFAKGQAKLPISKDIDGDVVFLVAKILKDVITGDVTKAIQAKMPEQP